MGGIAGLAARSSADAIAEAACVACSCGRRPGARGLFGAAAGGRAPLFEIELAELRTASDAPTPLAVLRAWAPTRRRRGRRTSSACCRCCTGGGRRLRRDGHRRELARAEEGRLVVGGGRGGDDGVLGASTSSLDEAVALLYRWKPRRRRAVRLMDQMASALGRSGGLLALLCQPAEVRPPVPIPPRRLGVDSGVRHSSRLDYGSVPPPSWAAPSSAPRPSAAPRSSTSCTWRRRARRAPAAARSAPPAPRSPPRTAPTATR